MYNFYSKVQSKALQYLPKVGEWWAGRSRLGQVGYVSLAAWGALYGISRVAHRATTRPKFLGQPRPGWLRDARTGGMVQQTWDDRTGHTQWGTARTRRDMNRLYHIG